MNVLDLFSGIGGFSLGLERAGMRTVAFCEIEPYCQAVLRKHWPDVPIFGDILGLTADTPAIGDIPNPTEFHQIASEVDVICGGFPCQPFSSAARGRRCGQFDNRYLWPEMLRIISECRPAWVIGENVTHIDGMALREVVSDLEGIGYEVAPPLEIPACAVGCDHRRSRLWILGYANGNGKSGISVDAKVARMPKHRPNTGDNRVPNGISRRMDRLRSLGNAIVPQIAEIIGRAIMNITDSTSRRTS